MDLIVNHICPIGTACLTAFLLKRLKLKTTSYPFDWISSSPSNILHMIENDFKIFLTKSYYNHQHNNCTTHDYYYINNVKMYGHHNPLINNDYEYYCRCVNRFKKLLKDNEKKLFIIIILQHDIISKQDIINFNNEFKKYTGNYILLSIFQTSGLKQAYLKTYYDNIIFINITTFSNSTGTQFENNDDNIFIDKVVSSLSISVKNASDVDISDVEKKWNLILNYNFQ
jgi:hypothetical protein